MVKKIFILFLLITLFVLNEFSLKLIVDYEYTLSQQLLKIRFINLLTIVSIILVFNYWDSFFSQKFHIKFAILTMSIVLLDILSSFAGFGYNNNSNFESEVSVLYPYDWSRGEPNALNHNSDGFKGELPTLNDSKDIKIAFFGGSTGYAGDPSIIEIISKKLQDKNILNSVYNFSSVGSNHNQHLHRLLDYNHYKFDYVIFYGGGNETNQHFYFDSREGYPYNFFIYENAVKFPFLLMLIKNSNFIGEIHKQFNLFSFSYINPQKMNEDEYLEWLNITMRNYFKTIKKSKSLAIKTISPNFCNELKFMSFFQPMNVKDERLLLLHDSIRSKLETEEIIDLYNLSEKLNFTDIIHIDQGSKNIVADEIFVHLVNSINKNCNYN